MADWAAMVETRDRRIAELEKRSSMLAALEAAGVDNWEGYGIALGELEEDEDDE